MVLIEKSFPRGGTVKQLENGEQSKIVFGARQKKIKKRNNKSRVEKEKKRTDEDECLSNKNVEAISAELLNYKTIQEEMILIGCIEEISAAFLKVILPGRIVGRIPVSSISDSYNKLLNKVIDNEIASETYTPLNEFYHIGQQIYVKVMKIEQIPGRNKVDIELSLKPKDVHANMSHNTMKKGMIFNGAIEEVQEHGYVIETGIKNLRCFLPMDKVTKTYNVGQLICVKIVKLTQDSTASTAICKEIVGENKKIKDLIDPRIDYILPTTIVSFTITKIMKDGLQGTVMNGNFTAYCNEHHLDTVTAVPSDYQLHSTHNARILYIMPITKLVYVSLSLSSNNDDEEEPIFKRGDIIENALVNRFGTGGIILTLNDQYKGVISFKSIKSNLKSNYDENDLLSKYYKNSKHKVRIIAYDSMEHLYVCTDNPSDINEKYFTLTDLKIGEFITGCVVERQQKNTNEGYHIQIGKIGGYIEKLFLSSSANMKNCTENSKIRFRVLSRNTIKNIVYLTNRSEYMSKNSKILTNYSHAKENRIFLGTIVKCNNTFLVVKFFNDIKGILYRNNTNNRLWSSFSQGQIMSFRIGSRDGDKLILELVENTYKIGEMCKGKIAHIIQDGLDVILSRKVEKNDEDDNSADNDDDTNDFDNQLRALVPIRFISIFPELVTLRLKNFKTGEQIKITCIEKNIFSLRDVEYFEKNPIKNWNDLNIGDIIRGFIKNVDNNVIEIYLPISGLSKLIKIHLNMFAMNTNAKNMENITLSPEQIVYVKILSKSKINQIKTITATAKLTAVWNGDLKITAELFELYMKELDIIKRKLKEENKSIIADLSLGEIVSGKIVKYDSENKNYIVKLENGGTGIIKNSLLGSNRKKLPIESNVKCVVLWIDYLNDLVYLSHNSSDLEHITKGYNLSKNLANKIGLNAKILLITNDVIICSLKKGNNPLVLIPTRIHMNDFEKSVAVGVKENEFCRIGFIHCEYSFGVFENIWRFWNKIKGGKRKNSLNESEQQISDSKKIKTEDDEKYPLLKLRTSDDEEDDENKNIESEVKNSVIQNQKKNNKRQLLSEDSLIGHIKHKKDKNKGVVEESKSKIVNPPFTLLPGPKDFWSYDLKSLRTYAQLNNESSDDEGNGDEKLHGDKNKKKKLTLAERLQVEKAEEARLREIEERNADPNMQPETVDQFERLVLANPNDSKIWINYMVFQLQATEIDKARVIARKALKTISYREEQELINIWVALLNLELRFGTKETFNDVFKESLLCNDPYKIYTRALCILSDAKKAQELTEMIIVCTKKFKDRPEMWKNAAIAYFDVDLPEKAKQLLHKALNALPERDHINTIVSFANLNHKYGDKETAHALFEQILTSYPKRVDVWSQYIDVLIKDQEFESARRTLDRAVIQKIPLKKMRIIFKKYLEFEEKYGTEENVLKVKEMAANYVQKEISAD